MLAGDAVAAEIELAVQPRGRLVGDQPQAVPRVGHLARRQPSRMAGAIAVAEPVDRGGEDLDLAAGGGQWMPFRIFPESPQYPAIVGTGRQFQLAPPPERVEIRRGMATGGQRFLKPPIKVAQPVAAAAALGKGAPLAQPFGQGGEDVVVVPGLSERVRHTVHGDQQRIGLRTANILAFQRHSAGEHDVGMARRGGPGGFLHHQRLRPGEGTVQPAEVLVVVERVAARPIDQPDVRVGQPPSIVVERLPGVQQHVGDPRHGDERRDTVAALRQRGQRHGVPTPAVMRQRPQRVIVARTRQPDLPQHRREHGRHPHRLLAMLRALQRMRHHDQRTAARHAAGQSGDGVSGNAGDPGRPRGVLRLVVGTPGQVVLEHRIPHAVALKECPVVQIFRHQYMRQPEQQRGVGAGLQSEKQVGVAAAG